LIADVCLCGLCEERAMRQLAYLLHRWIFQHESCVNMM
jgi:hypothetical protein